MILLEVFKKGIKALYEDVKDLTGTEDVKAYLIRHEDSPAFQEARKENNSIRTRKKWLQGPGK